MSLFLSGLRCHRLQAGLDPYPLFIGIQAAACLDDDYSEHVVFGAKINGQIRGVRHVASLPEDRRCPVQGGRTDRLLPKATVLRNCNPLLARSVSPIVTTKRRSATFQSQCWVGLPGQKLPHRKNVATLSRYGSVNTALWLIGIRQDSTLTHKLEKLGDSFGERAAKQPPFDLAPDNGGAGFGRPKTATDIVDAASAEVCAIADRQDQRAAHPADTAPRETALKPPAALQRTK